jgi:hypothetical protein
MITGRNSILVQVLVCKMQDLIQWAPLLRQDSPRGTLELLAHTADSVKLRPQQVTRHTTKTDLTHRRA